MKKKVFKPLQLNKRYITNLENHIKGGNTTPTHINVCGTGTSAANCTNRPSDIVTDCCLATNNNCGGGSGAVTAPTVEWCPTNEECVGPNDPVGPLATTIFPIC
ncbi:hypothetical protein [uncultured Kordia sp.]|uniref:hypothetical protein n=1 Tax=uncultured Kordia sp. TaxID=507699 RepID=UPI00262E0685|nr:hypothetical protein [uncultured Kordia sp.]